MIRNFKQAWQILKHNRFYSAIYITGAAISISLVMVIIIAWVAVGSDISPESMRSKTMVIRSILSHDENQGWMSSSSCSPRLKELLLDGEEGIDEVVFVERPWEPLEYRTKQNPFPKEADILRVNEAFWEIYDLEFIHGRAFTLEDINARSRYMVVSEDFAMSLYNRSDVLGEEIEISSIVYKITGVVKSVPKIAINAYSQIWIPIKDYNSVEASLKPIQDQLHGDYEVFFTLKEGYSKTVIKEAVAEKLQKINSTMKGMRYDLLGQPNTYLESLVKQWSNQPGQIGAYLRGLLLIIFGILIVPAFNLAGMISSSMRRRLEELGIRKTLGATNKSIMIQIINENLLLSALGGILGLFLAYVIIFFAGNYLIPILIPTLDSIGDQRMTFSIGSLVNPLIVISLLVVSFLLNILSAFIPARNAMKKNIVESLNTVKK